MTRNGWSGLAIVLSGLAACSPSPEPQETPSQYSRIVSLAPNLTELVFAAGAGDTLVGVSAYSDYPPEVKNLPVVGDAFSIDQEQLALIDPDALFVWQSGTPAHVVDELRRVGFAVEVIQTQNLADIASAIRHIGSLTGHGAEAETAARQYADGLRSLEERFAHTPAIRVFYQVSRRPLYTINGEHYVSELIELCGGRSIFTDLEELAPTITVEAVVERDPEVLLASDEAGVDAFAEWQRWPSIAANRYGNQFLIPADEIGRATPRVLVAGEAVCAALQQARSRRKAATGIAQ